MGLRCMFKELALFAVKLTIIATSVAAQAKPGCQSNCGDISIPYPFGTGNTDCNISMDFFIRCDNTLKPPKAFLTTSNIELLNISLDGYLRIHNWVGYACYNSSARRSSSFAAWITLSKFPLSHTRNKFTAIGCDTYAFVGGSLGHKYSTGCFTFCNNISDVINGSCSGIGCCQTAIPKGVRSYNLSFSSVDFHSDVLGFNPCSYGFVVEDGAYRFSISDLHVNNFTKKFPIILDWTIGNQTCAEAKMVPENYACKQNSYCTDPENGPGYTCKCLDGFQGNPYLSHGCQDINECDTLKPCNGTCYNVPGSYNCSCPEGYEGDGKKNGTGCSPKVMPHRQSFPILLVALGVGVSLLSSLLCSSWVYLGLRQRKFTKMKQKNFQQNGGILLREQLSKREECGETAKIFTAEELKKATNNYHESRILGQGGQGTVYKGILPDGRRVAIKKSIIGDQSQVQQFINEVILLLHINHRNVVKLLGCCLETLVPLLVYEYVRNGTLFDHLHNAARASVIMGNSFENENCNAKVSDFGASRLIPSDKAHITTLVQGTLGYLDPEYLHTSQLTDKSDVYSFGVVLIELLTGLKVLSFERPEQERNLSMYFVSIMKEELLLEILDVRVLNDKNIEQLKEVATLARRCVRVKGEERPTMKEVASELEGLRAMEKHAWGKGDLHEEEAQHLLDDDPYNNSTRYDGSTSISMGSDSIKNQVRFEIDGAR
ncbi:hypothetical protein CRYUN_Cryun41cG0043200 [Craigia yunnanensis]